MTDSNQLAHYGVKGQKWGVRKARTPSADVKTHRANKKKKLAELDDKELQKLVNRMNMEQQYGRLNKSTAKRGHDTVKGLLAVGATVNTAIVFSRSPAGQALQKKLAGAVIANSIKGK